MKAKLQKLGHFYFTYVIGKTQVHTHRTIIAAELLAPKKMENSHLRILLML